MVGHLSVHVWVPISLLPGLDWETSKQQQPGRGAAKISVNIISTLSFSIRDLGSHGRKVFGLRFFCPDTASSEPKSGGTVRRLGKDMPSPKKSITQIMVLISMTQPLGCPIWQGQPAWDHPSGPWASRSLSAALVSLLSLECAHFAFRILCSW